MPILDHVLQDVPGGRPAIGRLLLGLTRARTLAAILFRSAQLVGRRSGLVADAVKQLNQVITGADIAWQSEIGPGLALFHPQGVVIGPGVVAGSGLEVQQGVTVGVPRPYDDASTNSPRLGDGCLLGAGARVFGPITLGDDVTVGANAVCNLDAPTGAVVVGVPGRVVGQDAR